MKNNEKAKTTASLLSKALTLVSGSSEFESVRYHIRLALQDLKKKENKNKPKIHDEWWGNIVAGTSKIAAGTEAKISSVSAEAVMKKAIFKLDSMIQEETDKLKELEKIPVEIEKTTEIEVGYEILND
jgi:hypothetical protein